eukprot:773765-Pyramimonas_sp.AAC.1
MGAARGRARCGLFMGEGSLWRQPAGTSHGGSPGSGLWTGATHAGRAQEDARRKPKIGNGGYQEDQE